MTRHLPVEVKRAHTTAPVDLAAHVNNTAFTTRRDPHTGRLNVWGNSLPADSLPGRALLAGGIPFELPEPGSGPDNVRCDGQLVRLPPTRADWLHLLATSERRCEEAVMVHYASGAVDPEWLRVSDFWPSHAHFGEVEALRSTAMHYPHHRQEDLGGRLWAVRVPVPRREPVRALRLPDNPALHVFAITVETVH